MADTVPVRVLLVAATTAVDREVIVGIARRAPFDEVRVIAAAETTPTTARDQLDGIVDVLVEFEIRATGSIGEQGVDALTAADTALATHPADEVIVLVDAADDIAAWELRVADHGILDRGTPVAVLRGTAQDRTAA